MKNCFGFRNIIYALTSFAWMSGAAHGQALTQDIEAILVPIVGASWVTVETYNTYTNPVVVCTYNLASAANPPATVRMRNAGTTGFEIRLQQFENSSVVTPGPVHCLVVEEGAHTLSDGREIEAHTVLSTGTNGNRLGWDSALSEDIDATFVHTYSSLVLLGQVMTFNDVNASVFWTHDCSNRRRPPTNNNACVGKHIGFLETPRANETLGYIAIEAGVGTVNDVSYSFQLGPDTIMGVGNTNPAPPYTYSVSGDFDTVIATQNAEDGGNGGWVVLYGTDPIRPNAIDFAIDEEVNAGDTTRFHVDEQVGYAALDNNQTADLSADKSQSVFSESAVQYAIPGSDVIYTITINNDGSAPTDKNTLFLVDSLPLEVEFFNGDYNGSADGTDVIGFSETDSGLTLNPATDVAYSNAATKPADFAACTYTPVSGYDPNVRHICFNPKGRLRDGVFYPNNEFSFSFRARIN